MTPKKVLPKASAQSTQETPVPKVSARPKKSSSVAKKNAAKVVRTKPQKAAAQTPAKTAPTEVVKANTRSPARSPTSTQTRKPARVKKPALPLAVTSPSLTKQGASHALQAETASHTPYKRASAIDKTSAETSNSAAATPPVVDAAELWEQGSPIRSRIAQLRTRNAFLEEQIQRWRPPVQVRGKKK